MIPYVLIWGGGDLATGVAVRLFHVGIRVLVVETSQPLAVRRSVAFAQAVFDGGTQIEDVTGELVSSVAEIPSRWDKGVVPVIVDPDLELRSDFPPLVLIDARMRKKYQSLPLDAAALVIGLGPGFIANDNCHAVIETNRGHFLGRVYWSGTAQEDTGIPGKVLTYTSERVLFAPVDGEVQSLKSIGDTVEKGEPILMVNERVVCAPFSGILRGLIHDGFHVIKGMKVGDVDPRPEPFRCWTVSEKSLAIGGGVLEAILTRESIRQKLWQG